MYLRQTAADWLASRESVQYYCQASNSLGTVRSQVILQYPSFEGFNETMKNESVLVRIREEQAVALHGGYVGTQLPKPEGAPGSKTKYPFQLHNPSH